MESTQKASILSRWNHWWGHLPLIQKLAPALAALTLWMGFSALGGFKPDHFKMVILILALGYLGPVTRKVLAFLTPLILTALVYDSQRYYSDLIRGRIRVEEPYLFDKTYFGIPTLEHGVLTPNEWWQLHTHPILDLITGLYYLVFIGVFTLLSAYFVFRLARLGTRKTPAAEIARIAPRVMWAFFVVNIIGYSTYYWYPAAPPWYVSLYGLGPANLAALPNPAGCVRFDALVGLPLFAGFYGRSADVFGAIPSLHVAYPLISVWYAFRFGALRAFAVSFYLMMCFSAVYLNHHYVLDILWGSAYAIAVTAGLDLALDRAHAKSSLIAQGNSDESLSGEMETV